MRSFCIARASHIFCNKDINVFGNALATTVKEFVINELVKVMMLRTTALITNAVIKGLCGDRKTSLCVSVLC